MTAFALLPDAERTVRITEAAARLAVPPVIVEKDFWVCWLLGRIFSSASLGPHLIFKGGTSLSKVFGAIQRFSEDVDLSVAPKLLGWNEADLDEAKSRSMRAKLFARLETDCNERVRGDIRQALERSVRDVLGPRPERQNWLEYKSDQASNSPVLIFGYPSALPTLIWLHLARREARIWVADRSAADWYAPHPAAPCRGHPGRLR